MASIAADVRQARLSTTAAAQILDKTDADGWTALHKVTTLQ